MKKLRETLVWSLRIAGLVAMAVPVVMYVRTFGWSISDNHQRWADMGDFFSGVYTPVLTLLMLVVLVTQVRLQAELNRHTLDEAYVAKARADIGFCLQELAAELERDMPDGRPLKAYIVECFGSGDPSYLIRSDVHAVAGALAIDRHRVFSFWYQFYSVMAGLGANDFHPYSLAHSSSKQMAAGMLSYGACVALDGLLWSATAGAFSGKLEFADRLNGARVVRETGESS